jgi:hypothetical protein
LREYCEADDSVEKMAVSLVGLMDIEKAVLLAEERVFWSVAQ